MNTLRNIAALIALAWFLPSGRAQESDKDNGSVQMTLVSADEKSEVNLGMPNGIERVESWYFHEDKRVSNFKLYSVRLHFDAKAKAALQKFTTALRANAFLALKLNGKEISTLTLVGPVEDGVLEITMQSEKRLNALCAALEPITSKAK